MLFFQKLTLLCLVAFATSAPSEDLVVDLPGLDYPVNYLQYSGYLNGTPGVYFHYWFIESQNDSVNDPVFLWLNGGPGCSSVLGLLTELGPFTVGDDGMTLVDNPYSWNKVANVIYMESPACVGFSYDDYDNITKCVTNDDEVATNNYLALQDFFDKFPEYMLNDFYVTGESYGGIYIPTLSVKIVDGLDTFPLNFKGYAIGNGLTSYKSNDNSLMFYGAYHALFGYELWNSMVESCCDDQLESPSTCDFSGNNDPMCQNLVSQGNTIIYNSNINHYNLYGTCDSASSEDHQLTEYHLALQNLFRQHERPIPFSAIPCLDNTLETNYLNTPEVRSALNIPRSVQDWSVCSNRVAATYGRVYDSMIPQLTYLQSKVKGLVYNGDTDAAVNFLGNMWDIATLDFDVMEGRREWKTNDDVAGYVTRYDNFDFVTVRGAGHMVPEYRPMEALHMITAFINDAPY